MEWINSLIAMRRSILESELLLRKSSNTHGLSYIYGYLFGWRLSKEDQVEIDGRLKVYRSQLSRD